MPQQTDKVLSGERWRLGNAERGERKGPQGQEQPSINLTPSPQWHTALGKLDSWLWTLWTGEEGPGARVAWPPRHRRRDAGASLVLPHPPQQLRSAVQPAQAQPLTVLTLAPVPQGYAPAVTASQAPAALRLSKHPPPLSSKVFCFSAQNPQGELTGPAPFLGQATQVPRCLPSAGRQGPWCRAHSAPPPLPSSGHRAALSASWEWRRRPTWGHAAGGLVTHQSRNMPCLFGLCFS